MAEKHLVQQQVQEYTPEKEEQKGRGKMGGALQNDAAAGALNNKQTGSPFGNILSNYSGKNANQAKFSGEDPIQDLSDIDLIGMLDQVHYFDTHYLKHYYYDNDYNCRTLKLSEIQNYYNPIYNNGEKNVTQAHIDEFYRRIKEKGGVEEYKAFVKSDYVSAQIDDLYSYINKDGLLERVKKDGELLLQKAAKADELNTLRTIITKDQMEFNEVILQKSRSLYLTQVDVDKVPVFKITAEKFIALYNSSDEGMKSCFADEYLKTKNQITSYSYFLKNAPEKVKKSNEKRLKSGNNPAPATDGSDYVQPRKKVGKEDNPNKRVLKNWGVYKQTGKAGEKEGEKVKVDEYSIYKKDKAEKDVDEVDMNDAIQGALGDCYLISAIAGVARRRPDLIKSLIQHTPGESSATVTLHVYNKDTTKREAKKIKVNFYFPVNGSEPGYAKQGDNELWVMLIEKAYAQEMGGYANIEEGSPAEALAVLTGIKPTETGSDSKDLVEQLKTANDNNTAVVAGTKDEADFTGTKYKVEKISNSSIVRLDSGEKLFPTHAYTVLEYDEAGSKIKVRNPHGNKTITYYVPYREEQIEKSETFKAEFFVTLDEFKACFSSVFSSKLSE